MSNAFAHSHIADLRAWWARVARERLLRRIARSKAADLHRMRLLAGCEFPKSQSTR